MEDALDVIAEELTDLARDKAADNRSFAYRDGVIGVKGRYDGAGAVRALQLSERLTDMARTAGGLVVT